MRRSLYLYLFVFTALIVVFQYVTSRRMITSKEEEVSELRAELEQLKQDPVQTEPVPSEVFLLQANDNAVYYFEEMGYEINDVVQQIEEAVIGQNKAAEDNVLVPFKGMDGPMRINQLRILNHKWLLADFTDGTHWGELFITYYFDEKGELQLKTENSLLYPQD